MVLPLIIIIIYFPSAPLISAIISRAACLEASPKFLAPNLAYSSLAYAAIIPLELLTIAPSPSGKKNAVRTSALPHCAPSPGTRK